MIVTRGLGRSVRRPPIVSAGLGLGLLELAAPLYGGRVQSDSGRAHRIRVQNQALIAALSAMAAQGAFT